MADQLQLRRGTTSQVLAFTGAQGEVIVDTTLDALVVQDGITAGGFYAATAAQVKQGTFYYNEDVGSAANAYILVPKSNTNTPSSYQDGVQFGFVSIHPNTGPSTANFQGLGVKSLKYPGGVDPLAGDIFGRVYLIYDAANNWMEIQRKALGPPPQIRTIGASVASNALTATLGPCNIDFRATTLSSGTITPVAVTSQLSLVVPSGATLGTASATQSRLLVLAILNAGVVELAITNAININTLDETNLINTIAITSGAASGSVVYSAVARTGVPYRVIGFIESTQATAGTWATVPSTVQGAGGAALAAQSSIGFNQVWTNLTGSRALGTIYTNTTGRPIQIFVFCVSTANANLNITVNGLVLFGPGATAGFSAQNSVIVPVGGVYSANISAGTPSSLAWVELR